MKSALVTGRKYAWVGGPESGYAIYNSEGEELIRVWSELQAKSVLETRSFDSSILAANVLKALKERGVISPFK